MQIHNLRLENFGPHRSLNLEFRPGINGIIGTNGKGKSQILSALQLAWTGASIADGTKEDDVTWGEEDGSVYSEASHGDVSLSVKRTIKKSSQVLDNGTEKLTRKAQVNDYIAGLLDTTIPALLDNVFIPQGSIDSILFSTNTKRLKEFQQTVGLSRASDADRLLSKSASSYILTTGLSEQIKGSEAALAEATLEQGGLSKRLSSAEGRVKALQVQEGKLQTALAARQASTAYEQAAEAVKSRVGKVDTRKLELAKLEADLANLRSVLDAMTASAGLAETDLETYKDNRANVETAESLDQKLLKVAEALDKGAGIDLTSGIVEETRKTIAGLEAAIQSQQAQLDGKAPRVKLEAEIQLEGKLQKLESLLEQRGIRAKSEKEIELEASIRNRLMALESPATGECPTCEHPLDAAALAAINSAVERDREGLQLLTRELDEAHTVMVQELAAGIQETKTELAKYAECAQVAIEQVIGIKTKELQEASLTLRSSESVLNAHRSLISQQELLQDQRSQIDLSEVPDVNVGKLEELIQSYKEIVESEREVATATQLKAGELSSAEEFLQEAVKSRDSLKLIDGALLDTEIEDLQSQVEALPRALVELTDLVRDNSVLEVRIEQYESTLTGLRSQLVSEEKEVRWVELCKRVRKVLHVNALPSLLMREYAALLNKRIQFYLNIWETPFKLYLDEDLAFVAEFPDGRKHSGARLSGGQKIVASTSFRLAMGDTFARQVGLLILDEPSNYLDKTNLDQLRKLLLKLKDLAGSAGKQIILVTHEESLMGFLDHVIQL